MLDVAKYSISNYINALMLQSYNGELLHSNGIMQLVEKEIFSRAIGLLLSPAALADFAVHAASIPFSSDNQLQRVQDAVFPMLYGSVFAAVHPYLGCYAAEPVKKHIAAGILLSGSDRGFDAVCSPLTAMEEIATLGDEVTAPCQLTEAEKQLLHVAASYESSFEKIQSLDFFNLNLTSNLTGKMIQAIENCRLPLPMQEAAKRAALVAYPVLMLLDLAVYAVSTVVCLGALAVKMLGGQSSAYMETASSPEVIIANIAKIPLFLVSATLGFAAAWIDPKFGASLSEKSKNTAAQWMFSLQMNKIQAQMAAMAPGQKLLLPAVITRPEQRDQDLCLLPAWNSHMRYLLVEKVDEGHFEAELIERGTEHGKTQRVPLEQMQDIVERTLSLRYNFGHEAGNGSVRSEYSVRDGIVDLGEQPANLSNCVITNLFAAIQVIRHREGRNDFEDFCIALKQKAMMRYAIYQGDFYPFGSIGSAIEEILHRAGEVV